MSNYPNEPTIHESINQFFNFVEEFSEREDFDDEIENWDEEEEEGEPHPHIQSLEALNTVKKFIEEAYEIAFGDDAINRDWHPDAVIEELKSFSDKALKYDEGEDYE